MIRYVRGTECELDVLYAAFQTGFADYIIKFEYTMEQFAARFFGPEGNSREHSLVALNGDVPIGVALGGVKEYEGIRTMRCGALAVRAEERGQGVAARLMELHREEAVRKGCRQLYLEVIAGNDRAISFYNKLGYTKLYDLSFFSLNDLSGLSFLSGLSSPAAAGEKGGIAAGRIDTDTFADFVRSRRYFHLNWQNDLECIRLTSDMVFYGAFLDDQLIGTLGISHAGRIAVLLVDHAFRDRGAAALLLGTAVRELGLSKLTVSMSNNALMEGLLHHYGFERDTIALHEMYLWLPR
ncbi:GNAT family N-acetyltransferase [Paenibacillus sp. M1]|uniref:GNAT family N-acetyltransferase n=1 Tax=Paenibacillus haidiansis TaxID=1574488 RepID=A0ABU7VRJ3_9BACL